MKKYLWLVWAGFSLVSRAETLDLKTFLDQVRKQNQAVQGSALASEGAKERGDEADLLYTTQVFANLNAVYDQKRAGTNMVGDDF